MSPPTSKPSCVLKEKFIPARLKDYIGDSIRVLRLDLSGNLKLQEELDASRALVTTLQVDKDLLQKKIDIQEREKAEATASESNKEKLEKKCAELEVRQTVDSTLVVSHDVDMKKNLTSCRVLAKNLERDKNLLEAKCERQTAEARKHAAAEKASAAELEKAMEENESLKTKCTELETRTRDLDAQ